MSENRENRDKKDVTLRVRVSSSLKKDLESWCFENEQSMSRIMRVIIRMHLRDPMRAAREPGGAPEVVE